MVVTVFGSGHMEENFSEYQKAVALGRYLAESGYEICNGGYGGIMEASARGAKQVGGKTLGIINQQAPLHPNRWIDKVRVEKNWRDRLFCLIDTGDSYVFFDGGTGTLTELFTVWEMTNRKILAKPILIYGAYMAHLIKRLRRQGLVLFNEWIQFVQTPARVIGYLNLAVSKEKSKKR